MVGKPRGPVRVRTHTPRFTSVGLLLGLLLAAATFALSREVFSQPSTKTRTQDAQAKRITPEEFLASPVAAFFKSGDYPAALRALEALAKEYPDDPLILRYRAMVLDQLGRYNEAIALYKILLAQDPTHVPSRFFLGQAYAHRGDESAAVEEWQWVIQNSPVEEYRRLAHNQLRWLQLKRPGPAERKRFSLVGDVGLEYDSNPLLKPNDKALAVQGNEQQAERFSLNLGVGYQALARPDARVDVLYTTRQSLHDRGLDEVNFTSQELAVDGRKRVSLLDRDVTLGTRYDFLAGFLDGDLFSISNRFLFSSEARLTPHTRTDVYNRFTVSNFGPDGSNPPQTSRDGFYYDLGITQYLYTEDFRRYVYVDQELNVAQTRGANFTRRGTSTRVGVHTPVPVVQHTDLDVSGGLLFGAYPRFTSLSSADPERRRDTTWDLLVSLTHDWTPRLATRVWYRFVSADNRNDLFQYDRHLGGVQLLFTENF